MKKEFLKLKDDIDLKELDNKFNLDYEIIESDYEYGCSGDIEHSKGGVFISEKNKEIYGIDCSDLSLLFDLISANLVEKIRSEDKC